MTRRSTTIAAFVCALLAVHASRVSAQLGVPPHELAAEEALRRQLIQAFPGAPTFGVAMGAYVGGGVAGLLGSFLGAAMNDDGGEAGYWEGIVFGFPIGSMIGAPTGAWLLAGESRSYMRAWQGSLAGTLVGIGVGAVTQDLWAGILVTFLGQAVGAAFAVD